MPAPTVTTGVNIGTNGYSTIGNAYITDLGDSTVTQHGHCWSTSINPTTSDDKTTKGVAPNTGSFTSRITGLTVGTLYHVRAYATNSTGTSYGNDRTTTTTGIIGKRYWWVEDVDFHYFDEEGTERKIGGVGIDSDSEILTHMMG